MAGKRAGLKHSANGDDETTRSGLFLEAVRIIKEMRKATNGKYPKYAIWENVMGAFSSNAGEDFRVVLQELIKICEPEAPTIPSPGKTGWPYADCIVGDGWSLAWRVFNAQHWGVAQRRRRVYALLDLTDGAGAGKILFEREGLRGHFEEGRAPWQGTAGNPKGGAGADHTESSIIAVATQQGGAEISESGICPTITAAAGMSGNNQPWVCCQTAAVYGISSYESNAMKSSNPHAGIYEATTSRTLDLTGGNPATNQGGIVIIDQIGGQGEYYTESDVNSTLRAGGQGAVSYCMTTGSYLQVTEEVSPTLMARDFKDPNCVCSEYIVRRLTPTECARLQGFPDRWGDIPHKETFTDEEYSFWLEVRNTHAAINGRATKEYTKAQMLTWYNKLHSDSSEYKMWGNGIALPNALYVMQGIAEVNAHGRD